MRDWRIIDHFSPEEFDDPERMQTSLIHALDRARAHAGVPFILNSTYRDGDDGSHGRGWGVDIQVLRSRTRYRIVKALLDAGFHRIGVYNLHVHADMDPSLDPDVMWWGESE